MSGLIDVNLLRSMILISPSSSSSSSSSSSEFHWSRNAASGLFARSTARSFISRFIESFFASWRLFSLLTRARSRSGMYSLPAFRLDIHELERACAYLSYSSRDASTASKNSATPSPVILDTPTACQKIRGCKIWGLDLAFHLKVLVKFVQHQTHAVH